MTTDLDALEALAKAANAGPWSTRNSLDVYSPSLRESSEGEEQDDTICQTLEPQDAAYIAALSPSTVLALIAELRQERERADRLEANRRLWIRDAFEESGKARDALSRAEETIDRIDTALRGDGRSSVLVVRVQGIITEYREQKEADRG